MGESGNEYRLLAPLIPALLVVPILAIMGVESVDAHHRRHAVGERSSTLYSLRLHAFSTNFHSLRLHTFPTFQNVCNLREWLAGWLA